jgi:hypothetical protein
MPVLDIEESLAALNRLVAIAASDRPIPPGRQLPAGLVERRQLRRLRLQ